MARTSRAPCARRFVGIRRLSTVRRTVSSRLGCFVKLRYSYPPHLSGYSFEDSWVLAISVSPTRVQFLIDAAVTPSHPRFRRRERGEHFDFRRITLDFADVRLVAWRGQGSAALRTLGELGHIDSFVWLGNEFRLEGLWGRMVIVGNDPRVRFEKSQARRMRRLRQERGAALHPGAMQELKIRRTEEEQLRRS